MENDLLGRVIAAEKEIQKSLDSERKKVLEWLDSCRQEAAERLIREEETSREAYGRALADAEDGARKEAARIEGRAADQARQLGDMDDRILRELVMRHISGILPGGMP